MKKSITLLCFIFMNTLASFAQVELHNVYLKDNTTVRGFIYLDYPGDYLKLKDSAGQFRQFNHADIDSIVVVKNDFTYSNSQKRFAAGFGFQFSLPQFAGMFGMPLQVKLTKDVSLLAELSYRITMIDGYKFTETNSLVTYNNYLLHSLNIAAGPVVFLRNKFDTKKQKIIRKGITFKPGFSVGSVNETSFSLGWVRQVFGRFQKTQSFLFESGIGYASMFNSKGNYFEYSTTASQNHFFLYLKVAILY